MTRKARSSKQVESNVGVISDTHGLLRPQALRALDGCSHIIHAGDIGSEHILEELGKVAPITAVRGNNDTDAWAREIPDTAQLRLHGTLVYVLHDLKTLTLDPVAAGFSVVIAGHSHKPSSVERDGVLFLNPGSAGPRRFNLPLSVARLYVSQMRVRAEIVPL